MNPAGTTDDVDGDSAQWVRELLTEDDSVHHAAVARLHDLLLRAARHELRSKSTPLADTEFDDLAHQAATDSLMAILAKLRTFRGESRFTTWAYRFVILEVLNKLKRRRHSGQILRTVLDSEDWEMLPDRCYLDPSRHAEAQELMTAVRRATDTVLTERQRRLFIAAVIEGAPCEALAVKYGMSRNAVYKSIFDTRRKIRAFLVADGYLLDDAAWYGSM